MEERIPRVYVSFPDDKDPTLALLLQAKALGISGEEIKDFIISRFVEKSRERLASQPRAAKPGEAKEKVEEKPKEKPEVPTRRSSDTLGALLKKQNVAIGPEKFRAVLMQLGILEEHWRDDGSTGRYRSLTKKGLKYGKNLKKDSCFAVRYFEDTFPELFNLVLEQL